MQAGLVDEGVIEVSVAHFMMRESLSSVMMASHSKQQYTREHGRLPHHPPTDQPEQNADRGRGKHASRASAAAAEANTVQPSAAMFQGRFACHARMQT